MNAYTNTHTNSNRSMEVGVSSDIVLDGDPAPPQRGHRPQFSTHVCCGEMAALIKMPLGTEVGLGPGHIVLDGDPAPPPKRRKHRGFRGFGALEALAMMRYINLHF